MTVKNLLKALQGLPEDTQIITNEPLNNTVIWTRYDADKKQLILNLKSQMDIGTELNALVENMQKSCSSDIDTLTAILEMGISYEDIKEYAEDAFKWAKKTAHDNGLLEWRLTDKGRKTADSYIAELKAKRKEILDAGLDSADSTYIPVLEDIVDDVNSLGVDDEGEYYNGWAVTDNYDADYPLLLKVGRDLEEVSA